MCPASLYPRAIESRLQEAMQDTPVVLLAGPRQAGKTTLVRQVAAAKGLRYLTLDDDLVLMSAREDPVGIMRDIDRAIIDEIQRAPGLFLAIKKTVDEDRRPGRFLLTGSANLMTLPTVADSLAGRMETLSLLPLSQSEIERVNANWIDNAFKGKLLQARQVAVGNDLIERVLLGGYPEAISRKSARRRIAWARQYLDAIIQQDVRDISGVEKLDHLPRFLRALAQTAGQMCNYTKLGGQVHLDGKTAAKYLSVLEQMYLLKRVDVWATNKLSRIVKTPKLQFVDSGLLSALLQVTVDEVKQDRTRLGALIETFVYSELLKHSTTSDREYQLLYYRDADKIEVDVVIEDPMGNLVCVEVKAAATFKSDDLRGLKKMAAVAGKKFKLGVLLYDGQEVLPLGDNIWAAPLSSLWGTE